MALDVNEIRNGIREMLQLALDSVNCLNHFCRPLCHISSLFASLRPEGRYAPLTGGLSSCVAALCFVHVLSQDQYQTQI